MNRFWIAAGVFAVSAWALNPSSALGQCCGGGGHAQHPQEHAQPEQGSPKAQLPGTPVEKTPKLPACPVTDEPIDFSFKTTTEDEPVYLASAEALKKFTENPEPYAAKVKAQRAALAKLERIQVKCPVTGNPVDGKTFISLGAQVVAFCCQDCPAKYEADPAKYKANLPASYTYQARCPISNEKIDPAAYADLPSGQRIYFCCNGCDERFLKDPAKYAPKLAAQGINIGAAKPRDGQPKTGAPNQGKAKPENQGHDHGQHEHSGTEHP